jgi:hypothetical protein
MRNDIHHIAFLFLLGLSACLEPFNPDIPDNQQSFLVVDGIITDNPGPYTVKIWEASSFNDDNQPVSGVQVSIEEQDGPTENLTESSTGVYQTTSLQGLVGKSYRLNLNYLGQQYQSTWETIYASPEIDSVYYQFETRGTTEQDIDENGIQFFVDNQGGDEAVRHFRYEWDETWQLGVNWRSGNAYIGNDMVEPTQNPVYRCWTSSTSTTINLATTVGLTENVLSAHPLDFISSDGERFTERYSILIKQYALSETEYDFWKNLRESNQELGTLFDKQPANISGNISSNTGEKALGYFSASGVKEVRLYLDAVELPLWLSSRPPCSGLDSLLKADYIPASEYEVDLVNRLNAGEFFIAFVYAPNSGVPIGSVITPPSCSDCTAKGGDLNKPEFWDE